MKVWELILLLEKIDVDVLLKSLRQCPYDFELQLETPVLRNHLISKGK